MSWVARTEVWAGAIRVSWATGLPSATIEIQVVRAARIRKSKGRVGLGAAGMTFFEMLAGFEDTLDAAAADGVGLDGVGVAGIGLAALALDEVAVIVAVVGLAGPDVAEMLLGFGSGAAAASPVAAETGAVS